ncbi:metallophosphoesterase [Flavobacterium sp.]|jgi:calcineurin-like phosphoesterase family protein|uniref:metallophosphoesterase n=1 Tax=Flavobacterium sp. TaxID=239 RepID=UPI0037C1AE07
MSNVWFCSDLHFGHKNIQKFRKHVSSEEDNRMQIKFDWHSLVTKRDTVYVLGDACFTMDTIDEFSTLPGKKFLIRGNHDLLNTSVYLKYFEEVYGLFKYKEFWLSHAPIHPDELRNKINLHGHVHYETVSDNRYFNCCVENTIKLKNQSLISLDQIRVIMKERGQKVAGT